MHRTFCQCIPHVVMLHSGTVKGNCCYLYSVPFTFAILSLTVCKRVYNGYLGMFRDPVECACPMLKHR